MNPHDPLWTTYKQSKIASLDSRGYSVVSTSMNDHWLSVGSFSSPAAHSYLAADVQFYAEPSSYGIGQGRISRLTIRRYDRPTCRELFLGQRPKFVELYNYDRGLDVDRLREYAPSERFYKTLIDQLN